MSLFFLTQEDGQFLVSCIDLVMGRNGLYSHAFPLRKTVYKDGQNLVSMNMQEFSKRGQFLLIVLCVHQPFAKLSSQGLAPSICSSLFFSFSVPVLVAFFSSFVTHTGMLLQANQSFAFSLLSVHTRLHGSVPLPVLPIILLWNKVQLLKLCIQ